MSILTGSKYNRTQKKFDLLKKLERVSNDESEKLIVDERHTNVSASSFLYDLQQPTKKLRNPEFFKILEALNLKEDLVINSNAKSAIRKGNQKSSGKGKKTKSKTKPIKKISKNQPTTSRDLLTEDSEGLTDGFGTPTGDKTQESEKEWDSYVD